MLQITDRLAVDEQAIELQFVRSSGPGGQNVNKVATAVQLRFDVRNAGLPSDVQERLIKIAGSRMSQEGILIMTGRRFRTQEQNREDVLNRLVELIRRATVLPRPRKPTRRSRASVERRLERKRQTS